MAITMVGYNTIVCADFDDRNANAQSTFFGRAGGNVTIVLSAKPSLPRLLLTNMTCGRTACYPNLVGICKTSVPLVCILLIMQRYL